ncbi:MAG: right-handed parallel beta-helix repeat-containing protein [Verrucomicrobia bacterium]|nr:right-handed parallel beta-helix repeat-containing protein [Verrucomicrobiota bacterium]
MRLPPCTLVLLAAGLLLFPAGALHAQLSKIFVASTGNDANDGSRGSPKRNFQAAHDAVAAGGEIVVLDTAGYSALSITKSVSVIVPPGVNGFVTVSGNNDGIDINTANTTDVVTLRGLIIESSGGPAAGGTGIKATQVGTLIVEDCTIRSFITGVNFNPGNAAQASVYNTAVRGCADGLVFQTSKGVNVTATTTGCRIEQSTDDGGVVVATGSPAAQVSATLDNCTVRNNYIAFFVEGANAVLRASNCTITGNNNSARLISGGQVLSRGNNTLENNTNGNTFPATYSAK